MGQARANTLPKRLRLRVRGTVQGVGFRPYVHGLAFRLGLSGFVLNDGDGVVLEIEGQGTDQFVHTLWDDAPPLARIDSIDVSDLPVTGQYGFTIRPSAEGAIHTRIPPDAATCPECLNDLNNPQSRFYRYPFVTCTHCGPRYTITRGLPFDRPQTSLSQFTLCPRCQRDYDDITSRRYHAEALACPQCGPRLTHSIDAVLEALDQGLIVALKGIGGYHLMCDARNQAAVQALRERKSRESKPFAVMVAGPAAVSAIAEANAQELGLLNHSARPIVLLPYRGNLAPSVVPQLTHIGIMLPYAPLHHLLFQDRPHMVLVATSANPGGEPLVIDDQDAAQRLAGIADLIVGHDRPIVIRADDSVMSVQQTGPIFLRRARGFVPEAIDLGQDGPAVLAVGAHLKVTVTVTRGREAFVSQHVGCMDNASTVQFFTETVKHLLDLTGVQPERVICDQHPDLLTSRWADSLGIPVQTVQHHLAHVAAVVAEHRVAGPVLGVALDGHGYGSDGQPWGGELILLDGTQWQRVGHLAPLPMPGGDRAAREPWRMAVAALAKLGRLDDRFAHMPGAKDLAAMLPRLKMASTSSMGRVFDAAAALLGVCLVQHYEGQAAMELEALVREPKVTASGYTMQNGVLDLAPLLGQVADWSDDPVHGAEAFHGTLAAALTAWIAWAASEYGLSTIVLGGGCMANRVLADALMTNLVQQGLYPLLPRQVPAGDGGLSLGQAFMGRRDLCA